MQCSMCEEQHEKQQGAQSTGHKTHKGRQAWSKQQAGCTMVLLTIGVWHDCTKALLYTPDCSKQEHAGPTGDTACDMQTKVLLLLQSSWLTSIEARNATHRAGKSSTVTHDTQHGLARKWKLDNY